MIDLQVPLTSGKTADIFSLRQNRLLKLYTPGLPQEFVQHEITMTRYVGELGLDVPDMEADLFEQDGRFGCIQEHIQGPLLLEAWLSDPVAVQPIAKQLADTHQQIQQPLSTPHPDMPTQREWIYHTLLEAEQLDPDHKEALLAKLEQLPDGKTLCHGDFHPANILLTPDNKPIVIDWFSVTIGNPLADIAQTSFLLEQAPLPDPLDTLLTADIRQEMAKIYLDNMVIDPKARQELEQWQELIAIVSQYTM